MAPDISFEYDGKANPDSEIMSITVKPVLVRDDLAKADIFLKNLRSLGDDITNPNVLTSELTGKWAEEMNGPLRDAGEILYYGGRRALTPIVRINGDASTDPATHSIEVSQRFCNTPPVPKYEHACVSLVTVPTHCSCMLFIVTLSSAIAFAGACCFSNA